MDRTPPAIDELLTPREREVLAFLRLELTNEQIAARMEISADGVKYHVSEIIGKLGVRNRREAARWPERSQEPATGLVPFGALWRKAGSLSVKPSTAALALTGAVVVAAVAGIALMLFLLLGANGDEADGGASVSTDTSNAVETSDPRAIVDQALAAMTELDSYSTAYSLPIRQDDLREEAAWEVEFAVPDSYRFLLFGADGETERRCEPSLNPDGTGGGQTCYDVMTAITAYTVDELVFVGEATYARQCNETDGVCDPWREQPRGPFVIGGPSEAFLPGWDLVALELADGLELVSEDEENGAKLLHVRGSVNQIRAIFENQRRVFTEAGITSFGSECTSRVTPQVVEIERDGDVAVVSTPASFASDGSFASDENCRELTFEESLERQEPELSYNDEHPNIIDVWVSPDDALIRRIELSVPLDDLDFEGSFTIKYSLFNEVEIEAP